MGRGKGFDIGDLWDVIRTLHPTREMIIAAWSHALEYSIGTSAHGTNMMTAVCEKVGMHLDNLFMEVPTETPSNLVHTSAAGVQSVAQWRSMLNEVEANEVVNGMVVGSHPVGARDATLASHWQRMRDSRIVRNDFRSMAMDSPQIDQPLQAIRSVVGLDATRKYTNALFPTASHASMYYKPKALLVWATNGSVPYDESGFRGGESKTSGRSLPFKERKTEGGSKHFDFGWFKIHEGSAATWNTVAKQMKNTTTCTLFDMHLAGIADALFMMASSENSRLCAEMPNLPYTMRPSAAMVASDGTALRDDTPLVKLSQFAAVNGNSYEAADDTDGAVEPRPIGSAFHKSRICMHRQLDCLHQRCRLPMLQPFSSTNLARMPPLRRVDGDSFEVNSVACMEHLLMLMEAILTCSKRPGLRGLQENFASGGKVWQLRAKVHEDRPAKKDAEGNLVIDEESGLPEDNGFSLPASIDRATLTRVLPYAIDVMQMHWTIDLADRFYNPSRSGLVTQLNQVIVANLMGSPVDPADDVPNMTLRYPGFPSKETHALRLLSMRSHDQKPAGQSEVDIGSSSVALVSNEVLRYETEIALGREVSDADIDAHRRMLIGSLYTYGVSGDVYNYDTWMQHLESSMIGRGNTDAGVDADTDEYTDDGFRIMSDAEFLLELRLLERDCAYNEESDNKHLSISMPKMRTYGNIEKYGAPNDEDEATRQMRKRKEAPLTNMTAADRKRAALQKRVAKAQANAAARAAPQRAIDGDSRNAADDDD
tara:strand:- start:440 stop:2737 length:2298 start_codon:yes stop_codon:yes gene_type:complete